MGRLAMFAWVPLIAAVSGSSADEGHLRFPGPLPVATANSPAQAPSSNPLGIHKIADVASSVSVVSKPKGLDLDHDSKREFIIRKDEGNLWVSTFEIYESTADNSFALVHTIAVPGTTSSYYPSDAGDADGDGLSDLTVFGRTGNDFYIRLYESTTPDTFPTQIVWEVPVQAWVMGARVADTDNDGPMEIVTAGQATSLTNGIAIYEKTGSDNAFSLSYSAYVPEMNNAQSMEVTNDLDGDGRPEILFGGLIGGAARVYLFEAVADNAYAEKWSSDLLWNGMPVNASRIRDAGDLDGDGQKEFLVSGITTINTSLFDVVIVFEAQGNDVFQPVASMAVPGSEPAIAVADLDADGKKEIVLGSGTKTAVYRNTGDNSWSQVWQGASDIKNSVGAGDQDGDGADEIIFRTSFSASGVYEGTKVDTDSDGVSDALDNCSAISNPTQDDADADAVGDVCDNCIYGPNPSQGPAVFGQVLVASDANSFAWPKPAEVTYVRGPLAGVGTYAVDTMVTLPLSQGIVDTAVPAPGTGLYYLVKPDCPVGSWQSSLGAEPGRDDVLP